MPTDEANNLVKLALEVGLEYPVFPTNDKKPVWSNRDLDLAKGQGGYKIATQDPEWIKYYFSHENAKEISVPTGEASGLLVIDVDVKNNAKELNEWIAQNEWLHTTRTHKTRSGGYHMLFNYDPTRHKSLPPTLREFVDIKCNGGFVCWLGTAGYELVNDLPIADMPEGVLEDYVSVAQGGEDFAYNDYTDEELIQQILSSSAFHPALRTLSFRYIHLRKDAKGKSYSVDAVVDMLTGLMEQSSGKHQNNARHTDWLDRKSKIRELVESATHKQANAADDSEALDIIAKGLSSSGGTFLGESFDVATASPAVANAPAITSDEIVRLDPDNLHSEIIAPLTWIIPNFLPSMSLASLAGSSNVGKTRFLAAMAAGMIVGDTKSIGLPAMDEPCSVLWAANEERIEDIKRRVKAVMRHYKWNKSEGHSLYVRGKDAGAMVLVVSGDKGAPVPHEENIEMLIKTIRQTNSKVVMLDPFTTLASGVDENAARDAGILNLVFGRISAETGCSVLHTHHCPKDNSKASNWYGGTQSAWRGSGGIFSALDVGYTLVPFELKSDKKKDTYSQTETNDFIVLECAKMREGRRILPVFYELKPEAMAEGEGDDIGVCHLSTEPEARSTLSAADISVMSKHNLATELVKALGEGKHGDFAQIHKAMRGNDHWVSTSVSLPTTQKKKLLETLGATLIPTPHGSLQVQEIKNKPALVIYKKVEKT